MPNINEDKEFADLYEEYELNTEKRVEGKIYNIERNYGYLDVPGQRTIVRVKAEEIAGYNIGDTIEVIIVGTTEEENDQEFINASRRRVELENNWKNIEDSFENKTILKGKVVRKIKGGYIVEASLHKGFLPNSLSEINDSDNAIGLEIDIVVKDIKADPRDKKIKKITYSRKDVVMLKVKEEFQKIAVGDIVDCKVESVLDFGLAVSIGSIRGFIHISEISWKRVDKLDTIFNPGDVMKAKIISLDQEKNNVKLSIKKLSRDPWEIFVEQYKVEDEIEGTVTKIVPYGAFIEILEGVEGLLHVSDFVWNKKRVNISSYVKEGERIKVKILECIPETKKLKIGFKQLVENPWENILEKYPVGSIIKAKVLDVKQFGLFAEIEKGVDTFVHVSDYSWAGDEQVNYAVGDEVEFKVIDLNLEDKKIKGSIKALKPSPWDRVMEDYKVGTTVEKKIKNIVDFGIFIELSKGIDGFIPTQFASKDYIKNIRDKFTEGDIVKAQIVEINEEKQRIKLSIKNIEIEEEKRENAELLEKYGTTES